MNELKPCIFTDSVTTHFCTENNFGSRLVQNRIRSSWEWGLCDTNDSSTLISATVIFIEMIAVIQALLSAGIGADNIIVGEDVW